MLYTVTLRLETTDADDRFFEHVFWYGNILYNIGVTEVRKRINRLLKDKTYNQIMTAYYHSSERELSNTDKQTLKELRIKYGLSCKSDLEKYLKIGRAKFSKYVSSTMEQMIAADLYKAVEKFLYDDGKCIHYKKNMNRLSLSEKSNKSGFRYRDGHIEFMDKSFNIRIRHNDTFALEALRIGDIRFCRLKRRWHKHSYRYYVQLVIEGDMPIKSNNQQKSGIIGIDIGTSTIAIASDDALLLKELDDGIERIEKEIKRLNRKNDRQRRANNPDNYNADGRIRRNSKYFHRKWAKSKSQYRTEHQIKNLYAKRQSQLLQYQQILAKKITSYGNVAFIEDMDFKALAKRAKKTKYTENGKAKSKKRYGHSIGLHAPAQLVWWIEWNLTKRGGILYKVNPKYIKASQYNHLTGEYIPASVDQRWKQLDDKITVQRDLYSAYLLQHAINEKELDHYGLHHDFDHFMMMHNQLIHQLYENYQSGHVYPSCMGINNSLAMQF